MLFCKPFRALSNSRTSRVAALKSALPLILISICSILSQSYSVSNPSPVPMKSASASSIPVSTASAFRWTASNLSFADCSSASSRLIPFNAAANFCLVLSASLAAETIAVSSGRDKCSSSSSKFLHCPMRKASASSSANFSSDQPTPSPSSLVPSVLGLQDSLRCKPQ